MPSEHKREAAVAVLGKRWAVDHLLGEQRAEFRHFSSPAYLANWWNNSAELMDNRSVGERAITSLGSLHLLFVCCPHWSTGLWSL